MMWARRRGMLISPQHWRQYLKPRMANFIASSEGDQSARQGRISFRRQHLPIIPELIEIGLDILNPIQPRAWTRRS